MKVNFPIKNAGKNAGDSVGKNAGDSVGDNVGDKNIKLNKTQKSIIELIKKDKYITQVEIGINLNKTTRTIERNMKTLQDANVVMRIGSDIAGYWEILY